MNILQLCADWKWTGPAEPMLLLALALRDRGHLLELVCPEPPPSFNARDSVHLAGEARGRGMKPVLCIGRGRGFRPLGDAACVRVLSRLLDERDIEVVHTWHTRDHSLALRAARARRQRGRTIVIRSFARAEAIPATPWNRWLFGPGSDGLVCVSPESAMRNQRLRGARPTIGCFGVVDPMHFGPDGSEGARAADRAATRERLGLRPHQRVIGIAARVQRHRRFDLLFEAMRRIKQSHPDARLLVLGRGTHFDELARAPVERLGLADCVILAGYRRRDYCALLRAMDIFTYLVPGSDGSCRALLEAAASGLPAVVTRRGALREIVVNEATGLIVAEQPDELAFAWRRLLDDPELRSRMGAGARRLAARRFVPEHLAERVEGLYRAARSRAQSRSG